MEKHGVTICRLCFSPSNQFYRMKVSIKQPMHAQFDGISELRKMLQTILESNGYSEETANVCCRCNNEFKQIYSSMDRYSKNILSPIKKNSNIVQSSELNTIVRGRNHERFTIGESCKLSKGCCLAKVERFKKAVVRLKKLKMVTIDINSTVDYDKKFCKTAKHDDVENVVDGNFLEESLTDSEIEECHQRHEIKNDILENVDTESYQVVKSSNTSGRLIQTFLAKKELIDTSGNEISVENIYECDQCRESFDTKQNLHWHKRKIRDSQHSRLKRPFKCDKCEKDFVSKVGLRLHKQRHIQAIQACDQCSLEFPTRRHLQSHKRNMHTGERFKCDKCDKDFGNKLSLKNHKELHAGIIFQCDQCNRRCSTKRDFNRHKRRMHSGERFKCDKCEKDFCNKNLLNTHKEIHAGNIFECDQCNYKFPTKGYLQRHKSSMHSGKRYKCDKCEKDFCNKYLLNTHKEVHAGNIFNCDLCNRQFSIKRYLHMHKSEVHSEKRFKCDQCEKDYGSRWGLALHKRLLHLGKLFDCNQCSLKFRSSRQLCLHKCRMHSS